MKTVIVYPFSSDYKPVTDYIHMLSPEYDIKAIVSPKGWGYVGIEIDNKKSDCKNCTLTIQSDFSSALTPEIDTLLIPHFISDSTFELKVVETIIENLSHFKLIFCYKQFNIENFSLLQRKSKQTNCKFIDMNTPKSPEQFSIDDAGDFNSKKYDEKNSFLKKISTPIIVVCGMGEDTDKFEVSLVLQELLSGEGFQSSVVGSKQYEALIGVHAFPSFMFHSEVDERQKVICFNRYIKNIELEQQPDVIIISIPGAVKAYSEEITQGFGLLHYMVFQAVLVDYFIMCSYLINNDCREFLCTESDSYKGRFGCGIDCYHISNKKIDYHATSFNNRVVSGSDNDQIVEQAVKNNNTGDRPIIINAFHKNGKKQLLQDVLDKLRTDFILV